MRATTKLVGGILAGLSLGLALPAGAAMYKWVDENGKTHYGDRIPPRYAKSAGAKALNTTGVAVARPAPAREAQAAPAAKVEAAPTRAEIERKRRDDALLATYANADEIERARARELKTVNDWLARSTAGLAKSDKVEDRKRMDEAMSRAARETDAINAKYDAQKARFQELRGGAPAAAAEPAGPRPGQDA